MTFKVFSAMYMTTSNSKYWDIDKTLSYNCMFNFIKGIRGCGKTYSILKRGVERYKKTGKRFMYVRRTEEELKKLTIQKNGRLFNHVQVEFPSDSLWAESNVLHLNDKVCGYAQPLSTAAKLKSDALLECDWIIFDEYIKTSQTQHYLKDEVIAFLELCETLTRPGSRDYDVKCFFLGNAVSSSDPYTDYFKLELPYKTDIWKRGEFLVQMVAPPELIEAKKGTRFYKALAGTEYEAYAVENKFLTDNPKFLGKKTKDAEYQFTLLYFDDLIGVWRDYRNGRYYISDSVDKQCRLVYACTTEDHEPNTLLLKGFKSSVHLKNLKAAYDIGCVFYENQRLYNWFRDIVRMGM